MNIPATPTMLCMQCSMNTPPADLAVTATP
jgi:hypothetical protein